MVNNDLAELIEHVKRFGLRPFADLKMLLDMLAERCPRGHGEVPLEEWMYALLTENTIAAALLCIPVGCMNDVLLNREPRVSCEEEIAMSCRLACKYKHSVLNSVHVVRSLLARHASVIDPCLEPLRKSIREWRATHGRLQHAEAIRQLLVRSGRAKLRDALDLDRAKTGLDRYLSHPSFPFDLSELKKWQSSREECHGDRSDVLFYLAAHVPWLGKADELREKEDSQ